MNAGLESREISLGARTEILKPDFAAFRRQMVERQLRARGIRDQRVLDAMFTIPREEFVSEETRDIAYMDQPVSIGEGQTISQPFMVASMAEALHLVGYERVLEVGTGSGYAAAVLSRLAKFVYTVESRPALSNAARDRLARLGLANTSVHTADGSQGLNEFAPFDAIVVAAAAPRVPQPLVDQLAEGGRLVIPVGEKNTQDLVLVQRRDGLIASQKLYACRFVPLTGRYGFHS